MDISLPDAESTVEFGRQLGRALNEQYAEGGEQVHIILFYGDLGSGKTTFTRGFIEALPGGENAEVSSPSFTLCNSYPTTPSVIHCDLYRSEGALPDEVDEALDTESGLCARRMGRADRGREFAPETSGHPVSSLQK